MSFERFRQYRESEEMRDRHAECSLAPSDFIQPYFLVSGRDRREEIPNLPGVFRWSVDRYLEQLEDALRCGIERILLFGAVDSAFKDPSGSYAHHPENPVMKAVRATKERHPSLLVCTDLCLCGYTDHGHCGVLKDGKVLNDESLPLLAAAAEAQAAAGADCVAPSAMMDGQVQAIRKALDRAGFGAAKILSYSAKFASGLYGPFRDAAGSAPKTGDRKSYQMDYRNASQAVKEVAADLEEGADAVIVKPAGPYLDIVRNIRTAHRDASLAVYQVTGEYAQIKLAARAGVLPERRGFAESFYGFKRAGADYIISYYARDFLREGTA